MMFLDFGRGCIRVIEKGFLHKWIGTIMVLPWYKFYCILHTIVYITKLDVDVQLLNLKVLKDALLYILKLQEEKKLTELQKTSTAGLKKLKCTDSLL